MRAALTLDQRWQELVATIRPTYGNWCLPAADLSAFSGGVSLAGHPLNVLVTTRIAPGDLCTEAARAVAYVRVLPCVDDPDRLRAFAKSLCPLDLTPIVVETIEAEAVRLAVSN